MSLREFKGLIRNGDFGKKDKEWFPAWLKRFAEHCQANESARLPLTRELAIGFSRELLANGVPAWQRKQAIRALCAYRDMVLHSETPMLSDMVRKLGTVAEQQRSFPQLLGPAGEERRAVLALMHPGK